MLALFKNVLFSALIVAAATVASVTIAFVAALFLLPHNGMPEEPFVVVAGAFVVGGLAVMAGAVFSGGTLFAAALTMPPTIWIARVLRLPRPLFDVIGGGSVAALCVAVALAELDDGKLAELATPDAGYIFKIVGVLGGCIAGYMRYTRLVRSPTARIMRDAQRLHADMANAG